MAYRYTVTTHTRRCPYCGDVLEKWQETTAFAFLLWLVFPIVISYYLLKYFAFSGAVQEKLGPKYDYCHKCFNIVKTGNHYAEELYGEYLLNYKFNFVFYIAYGLGSIMLSALLIGLLDGFTISIIVIVSSSFCALAGIIITYRVLLVEYRKQKSIACENIAIIKKKQDEEYQKILYNIEEEKSRQLKKIIKKQGKDFNPFLDRIISPELQKKDTSHLLNIDRENEYMMRKKEAKAMMSSPDISISEQGHKLMASLEKDFPEYF